MLRAMRKLMTPALLTAGMWLAFGVDSAQAAQVSWRTDVKTAVREAEQQKKLILLQVTASWCTYCHKMLNQTFSDAQIIEHVNGCFIPLRIDADEQESLVNAIGVDSLPTTVIVSPALKVVDKITGFKTARELGAQLGKHCQPKQPEPRAPKDDSAVPAAAGGFKPASPADGGPDLLETTTDTRYAFRKLCLVSLLDGRQLAYGSEEHTSTYKGQTLCFAAAEFQQRFEANPQKYWPVGDGHCPVHWQDSRDDHSGDPEMAVIYRGRVWFCADLESRMKFAEQPVFYSRSTTQISSGPEPAARRR